jgi:hypothetical protein
MGQLRLHTVEDTLPNRHALRVRPSPPPYRSIGYLGAPPGSHYPEAASRYGETHARLRYENAGAKIVAVKNDVDYVAGKFREAQWLLTRGSWITNRLLFFGLQP